MIDSHLHLDDERFDGQVEQIVADLDTHGIDFVINNSADLQGMLASFELANKYEKVFATVGMHPHTAKDFDKNFVELMCKYAKHPKVVAVGEIGLDYYYDLSERQIQRDVFAEQIEIADKLGLPITLHIRDAYGDAMDVLTAQKRYLNNNVLWHCYSGSAEFAKQCVKLGHYFAFGGAITFKNAKKEEVIQAIPFERILTETDAPYMAPVPLRGTTNTPLNIPLIVDKIALTLGKTPQQVEEQVYANTLAMFPKIKDYLNK
jgi:TatD DNase family protein